ncbi:hypothetical protein ACFX1Z_023337 [Malus domestica]
MEGSGQGIYSSYSVIWGSWLYCSFILGVSVLFIFTSSFDVETLVREYRWYRVDGEPMGIFKCQRIDCRNCIYGSYMGLVGSFKESQFLLPLSGR